jgi:hypothetical protein
MNEILNNYKLFGVIFVTIILMVVLIYKFLFKTESREDKSEILEHKGDENLNSMEDDEKVFQQFNKLLPPAAGSIYFLRNNNMTMVFHKRALDGLYKFYEGSKNGEYVFTDIELEDLKTDLYLSIEQYLLTFELNSKETSSGYYRVNYNIDGLHMLVDELLNKYDKLSSASQKKLLTL